MKSVFVINGFLSSGKTQFIHYTLAQPYFKTKGTTLLIVCEEGEEEYDPRILKATNTVMVNVENEADVAPDKLMELEGYPIKASGPMQEAWEFIMNAQDAIDRALEHIPDDED